MTAGTLYGIGVGPGDPELMTVKGARLLSECKNLFTPKARIKSESLALRIVERYVPKDANVVELLFPMVTDKEELTRKWDESARVIADVLEKGEDGCFITIGDSLLYSTYIYLVRSLRKIMPDAKVITIPGITAFSAVASLTNYPVGEGKKPVTIIPTADDLTAVENAVDGGGTVILMKIGKRLSGILEILETRGVIDNAVFVANAGSDGERIETDLRKLKSENAETGYLATIIVDTGR